MSLDDFKSDETSNREYRGNQHTGNSAADMSDEEIVDEVAQLADSLGETPTMREATSRDNIPSGGTITNRFGSWNNLLEKAKLKINQVEEYSSDEREDMLDDIRKCFSETNGYLTVREYISVGDYGHDTIKKTFGSWKEALDEANVSSGSRYGHSVDCQCGQTLDSMNEKVVGDILHSIGVNHEVHTDIPESDFKTDFYIPNQDVWIEVDGYEEDERPNRESYEDKLEHYSNNDLTYLEIKVPYQVNRSKVKSQIQEFAV